LHLVIPGFEVILGREVRTVKMCGADLETNTTFVKRYSKKGGLLLLVTIYRFCLFELFTLI